MRRNVIPDYLQYFNRPYLKLQGWYEDESGAQARILGEGTGPLGVLTMAKKMGPFDPRNPLLLRGCLEASVM